ncbi:hypothetical protein B0H11DRAFT_1709504 [Mycena galericulata]|nr:hypothetical protein B0H11DRAFT_1710417 [Mycena galericulata]KAJ7504646.1 hypothetical protein B0H11DRAFT_1709504 [Mycena galericulata]
MGPSSGVYEEVSLVCLSSGVVPLIFGRFVNRSHRFGDAYFNHKLTGPQAAWIAKKFPGHRTYPESILAQLDAAGIH